VSKIEVQKYASQMGYIICPPNININTKRNMTQTDEQFDDNENSCKNKKQRASYDRNNQIITRKARIKKNTPPRITCGQKQTDASKSLTRFSRSDVELLGRESDPFFFNLDFQQSLTATAGTRTVKLANSNEGTATSVVPDILQSTISVGVANS